MANDDDRSVKPLRRTLLVTYPRTASNLVLKMLSLDDQEKVVSNEKGGYFFWDSYMAERSTRCIYKPVLDWAPEETEEIQHVLQRITNELEQKSRFAESQGRLFFAKEHVQWFTDPAAIGNYISGHCSPTASPVNIHIPISYGPVREFSPNNLTVFPDQYLETWRLTFLIRHPALAFPSLYRAMRELEKEEFTEAHELQPLMEIHATLKWTRQLYDWCCKHQADSHDGYSGDDHYPLVLDAQDVIHNPSVIRRYCKLIGMDPAYVKYDWSAASSKKTNGESESIGRKHPETIMKFTLDNSLHIIKEKTPPFVDIALERKAWDAEFGEVIGKQMEGWVMEAMPDYDYLKSRRLQVKNT
ncbi:hypothetical protein BDV23DRAFT_178666 [Aspergillus alliaceus]|uniref:P-loop containing nucleoside triphosphate hydrolase protein n=1 Tax=Petromyces alliaceus TaxID=209559 RepID=A0A5N7CN70_PETAA|nr:hypothetical protein BDV23DRAFT_178666 [Aspergillus alliaceus]